MGDRGQSEVLGFVIIFGLIISGVAMVTATGYGGLEHTRHAEQVNNAAVAFEVMADNFDELVRSGAPSRSVEIKLEDAQLTLGEPVHMRVAVTSVANPNQTQRYELEPRPIIYDARTNSRLVYLSGALIRVERSGLVMLREPTIHLSADRTVLPILETRGSRTQAVGGSDRVHVRAARAESPLLVAESTPQVVTLEITSPRVVAWDRHLERIPQVSCSRPGPTTVNCSLTTDRVYVVSHRTDVEFR